MKISVLSYKFSCFKKSWLSYVHGEELFTLRIASTLLPNSHLTLVSFIREFILSKFYFSIKNELKY